MPLWDLPLLPILLRRVELRVQMQTQDPHNNGPYGLSSGEAAVPPEGTQAAAERGVTRGSGPSWETPLTVTAPLSGLWLWVPSQQHVFRWLPSSMHQHKCPSWPHPACRSAMPFSPPVPDTLLWAARRGPASLLPLHCPDSTPLLEIILQSYML